MLEIAKSSTLPLTFKSTTITLMNEQFKEGEYSESQNVNCSLQANGQGSGKNITMKIRIYEFTPYWSCTQLCLSVEKSPRPPFCYNSRQIYTPDMSFHGVVFWRFNLTFTSPASCISKVRYWIELLGKYYYFHYEMIAFPCSSS